MTARLAPLSSAVDVVRSEMENVPKKADGTMPTAEKDFDHVSFVEIIVVDVMLYSIEVPSCV